MNFHFWLALTITIVLSGCVSSPVPSLSPEQKVQAENKISVRSSNISTVEFKELGDSKRYSLMSSYIRQTWNDTCKVVKTQIDGCSPNGSSTWKVNCDNTGLAFDYIVTIPEQKSSPVRVLKCYSAGHNRTQCSIVEKSS
jgi:hypothetical protein